MCKEIKGRSVKGKGHEESGEGEKSKDGKMYVKK
jgi:hypothetical protein